MRIEFDEAKDERNRSNGEERWVGVAPHRMRLYTIVFTVTDDETVRVISVRRATNREIEGYERQRRKQEPT